MDDNGFDQYSSTSRRFFANLVLQLLSEAAAMYSGLSCLLKSPLIGPLWRLQQTGQSAVHPYPRIRAVSLPTFRLGELRKWQV